MKKINICLLLLLTSLSAQNPFKEGKEHFDEANCVRCHDASSFKHREDKVNNIDKLAKKVKACEFNTHTGWFEEERTEVVKYLNHQYYHYK